MCLCGTGFSSGLARDYWFYGYDDEGYPIFHYKGQKVKDGYWSNLMPKTMNHFKDKEFKEINLWDKPSEGRSYVVTNGD